MELNENHAGCLKKWETQNIHKFYKYPKISKNLQMSGLDFETTGDFGPLLHD